MLPDSRNMKTKILEATVDCIEEMGIEKVSVRKICLKAGVNVASVNYYFRTKEELLDEALKLTLKNGFTDLLAELDGIEQNAETICAYFLNFIIEGAVKWPKIIKAHLYKSWNGDYNTYFAERLNEFLDELYLKLRKFFPEKTPYELRGAIIQMFSAAIFPGIMPGLFEPFIKADFSKKEDRKKYVKNLITVFLTK